MGRVADQGPLEPRGAEGPGEVRTRPGKSLSRLLNFVVFNFFPCDQLLRPFFRVTRDAGVASACAGRGPRLGDRSTRLAFGVGAQASSEEAAADEDRWWVARRAGGAGPSAARSGTY